MIDEAMALSGADYGDIYMLDRRRKGLVLLAQRNFRPEALRPFSFIWFGDGRSNARCLTRNAPVAISNVNDDGGYETFRDAAREAGFKAVQSSPLRDWSGDLIGVLSLYYRDPRSFTDVENEGWGRYAAQASIRLLPHLALESGTPAVAGRHDLGGSSAAV